MDNNLNRYGRVFLVGAGPGDPGLLTLRGKELLEQADVVIYDYLADSALLEFAKATAVMIDVGKRPNRPTPQNEINDVIIGACLKSEIVVRLKGGDPMLFGRGGEELEALTRAGIRYEVVPGVTSAIAVPAFAGIPVTHRGVSTSLTIITGHRQANAADDTDFGALVRLGGTIVVLMGVENRGIIASRLMNAGMDPKTPIAAIRWGTRPDQSTVRGQIDQLESLEIFSPATIVIGSVAGFNFDFFESRPLFGKSIVITRDPAQQGQLERRLKLLGARVISAPTIKIVPPKDAYVALDESIARLDEYSFLIFTSTNAVSAFFGRLDDLRKLGKIKIAAVGSATRDAILKYRIGVDIMPQSYVGDSLLAEFPDGNGERILIPRAFKARDVLPKGLRLKGYEVTIVPAYETQLNESVDVDGELLANADAICFTSSSTVQNFVKIFGSKCVPRKSISIGPVTSQAMRALNLNPTVEAKEHNLDGLIRSAIDLMGPDMGQ